MWPSSSLQQHTLKVGQDVYVVIRKLDKDGQALWHQNIPMKDLPEGTTADDIPKENIW